MNRAILSLCLTVGSLPFISPATADALDITGTSLSELMNLKITSLSKKSQSLDLAPAAVFVLSADEIRRMGVTHIADALRYVPGVEVAQLDAARWAVSMRGFNGRAANKLLVMIDGRSIYSTLFSGVLWEEKDLLLDDIDRIEVIRGPGGAIWGVNAVNGVINIITRHSSHNQGLYASVAGGSDGYGMAQGRVSWRTADTSVRVYGKVRRGDDSEAVYTNDDVLHRQGGFRLDHSLGEDNELTLQGDIYSGVIGDLITTARPAGQKHHGGNLMLTWQWQTDGLGQKLQSYYDSTSLELNGIIDKRHIVDLEYQLDRQLGRHSLIGGLGYRAISDKVDTSPYNFIHPVNKQDEVFSAFIQDDIGLLDDSLHLILGSKFEHNDYSGQEWQPNIRLSYGWDKNLLWGSWSRAVRVPTRWDTDVKLGSFSGEYFGPERAKVYELGWRNGAIDALVLDATLYYSDYDDLQSIEADGYRNEISGHGKGIELSGSWQASEGWLLRLNYTHSDLSLRAGADSQSAPYADTIQGQTPGNMVQLSSLWDIDPAWQFNAYLRFVDNLGGRHVDSYLVADLSLIWSLSKQFFLQLSARDLGGDHQEWDLNHTQEASYSLNLTWTPANE